MIYKFGSFHTNSFKINKIITLSLIFALIIVYISFLENFSNNLQLNLLFECIIFLLFISYSLKMVIPLIVYLNQQNNFLKTKFE